MTDGAESGKRGGLFSRLFGGGHRDAETEEGPAAESARRDDARADPRKAHQAEPEAPGDEEDEDALVLGPALKAPADDRADHRADHRAGGEAGGGAGPEAGPDESEDELTLGGDIRTSSGEEGDGWAGESGLAEEGRGEADDLPDAEALLARLRARRDEAEPADEPAGEDAATLGGEASGEATGAQSDRPDDDRPETAGFREHRDDEQLSEEDALVARLRAAGAGEWSGDDRTASDDETLPGEGQAADAGPDEATPMSEEGHASGLSWLSGEERDDGEGTIPASDAGPEGRETMEAEEMGRDDETEAETGTEAGDDALSSGTETPATPLFPGATTAGESEQEDDSGTDEADAPDEELRAALAAGTGADSDSEPDPTDASGEPEGATDEPLEATQAERSDTHDIAATPAGEDPPGTDRDSAEAEIVGILAASAADTDEAPGAAEGAPNGATTDSAAFEESVRRLIREELEGEMGERLSRNIRKMIREEVAHALLRNR